MYRHVLVVMVLLATPLFGGEKQDATVREFLAALEARDTARLEKVTDEFVYIVLVTEDEHIVLTKKNDGILPGFDRVFENVTFTTREFSSDDDLVILCAAGRHKSREAKWVLSFEFRKDRVKNILFLESTKLCDPAD